MVCPSQEYVEIGSSAPIESENLVEFRLLFDGQIGSDSRAPVKQAIRKALHPQLRRLWQVNRNLRALADHKGKVFNAHMQEETGQTPTTPLEDGAMQIAFQKWGDNWSKGPFRFVPLVTRN